MCLPASPKLASRRRKEQAALPGQPPAISDETLKKLGALPTQTLIDGLWVKNWPQAMVHGARPLFPGKKMAGRAVTLRFVPHRPDIAADKPKGEQSAEYAAFELCGPGEVLVASSVGPWESIGGDSTTGGASNAQSFRVDAPLWGTCAVTSEKSAELSSVSVHPPFFRTAAIVDDVAPVGPVPSKATVFAAAP